MELPPLAMASFLQLREEGWLGGTQTEGLGLREEMAGARPARETYEEEGFERKRGGKTWGEGGAKEGQAGAAPR